MKKPYKIFSGRNIYLVLSALIFIGLMIVGSIVLGPRLVETVKDPQAFREFLGESAVNSYLIFIAVQFIQIVFAFIPGEFIEFSAGYAFGSVKGAVLCLIGVAIATFIIFGLTRLLGKKFTNIMIDSKELKHLKFLKNEKKIVILFALLYFIPGTPKDLLTYFAGITSIKFSTFMIISVFCRIPSIITSTMAGAALGERQYLQSAVIFAITAVIGVGGYFLYQFITQHRNKKDNK